MITFAALPRATVKMQQTQPLVNRPAPVTSAPAVTQSLPTAAMAAAPESDSTMNILAIAALIASVFAAGMAFLVFNGSSPL